MRQLETGGMTARGAPTWFVLAAGAAVLAVGLACSPTATAPPSTATSAPPIATATARPAPPTTAPAAPTAVAPTATAAAPTVTTVAPTLTVLPAAPTATGAPTAASVAVPTATGAATPAPASSPTAAPSPAAAGPTPTRAVPTATMAPASPTAVAASPTPAPRRMVATTVTVAPPLRGGAFATERRLQIREGFSIALYARVPGARSLELAPWGELLVTQPTLGRIVVLGAATPDGVAGAQRALAEGLECPYGMAFHDGKLYVAQTTRVERFAYDERGTLGRPEVVVPGLPPSPCRAHHFRPLAIDAGGNVFVAFGSTCNVCVEEDRRRGTVWRYAPDGTGREFARGLRNVVDLEFRPTTSELWGATNERDELGDDVPPDPVGPIVQGADYGWPYCYWDGRWVVDPRVPARAPGCGGLTPYFGVQAHSAPLGLAFATDRQFPAGYAGSAYIGLHGSWNRTEGTGFKVIRVPIVNGQPQAPEDFVTGWLTGSRGPQDAWGRPVDVQVAADGALLISDDAAGAIYRVAYTGR